MGLRQKTLDVSFRTKQEFEEEYAGNIANGGIFIETRKRLAVRDKVTVKIKLRFIRKGINLKGEVVHVVGEELAASGATPGVAVQLEAAATELRGLFDPLLAAIADSAPEAATSAGPTRTPATGSREEPGQDDRRGAPRSRARVRARVFCPGCESIEGRTRDLSITGVLVSIGSAPAIAIGEPVKVLITHPETGIEREILGKVARHVKSEGNVVRAIGVQFYVRDSERRAVEQFLRDLRATEHSRHLGGIQGDISEVGLINLVQTFGLAAREGTLDVMHHAEEGYLAFENGCLRAANLGGTRGIKALARMLTWTEGHFEFHARIDPALPEGDQVPLDAALLEAMRLMDEGADVDRGKFPPDALLDVDNAARDASDERSKLEEAILDLATTGMNVQRILDVVPETDDEIYVAMWALLERGLVSIRPA
jgi:Tfp pilus assembly protein PilZ